MKITEEQAEQIAWEECDEFETVEVGEWEDDGKYSHQINIFKHDGKYYANQRSRCGSYHTDYDYNYYLDCQEVEQVEVTVKQWVDKA